MHRAAFLDAPKTGDSASLSDDSVRRIQAQLGRRTAGSQPQPSKPQPTNPAFVALRAASMTQALGEAAKAGFRSAGGGLFHKAAHDLWTLERRGSGYGLTRLASEPSGFPDDKVNPDSAPVEEAPTPQEARTASFRPGSIVTYPLGGDMVTGRVVRASRDHLDVQLPGQLDEGVPVAFVRAAQLDPGADSGAGSDHERNKEDLESMGTTLNPTAARNVKAKHWASYGALLADQLIGKKPTAALLAKVNGTGRTAGARPKVSAWQALASLNGPDKTEEAQGLILAGVTCRQASKQLNVPFAWTWEMRDVIADRDPRNMQSIVAALRGDAQAKTYCEASIPRPILDRAITAWKQVQAGQAPLQKVAVDQAAEDYWKAYYGDYGEEWVREVKRRVKADLLSATLQKSGVDQSAADYWSDYYGDYGDQLVDEPKRSVDSKTAAANVARFNALREERQKRKAAREPARASGDPPRGTPHNVNQQTLPAPVRTRNVFAGITRTEIEESIGDNRVAVVKIPNGYNVLIRTKSAQKIVFRPSMSEAAHEFRVACRLHLGISA